MTTKKCQQIVGKLRRNFLHAKQSLSSGVHVAELPMCNTIGASELDTVWTDPDFNPAQKAFHYARVIEIPTPRWTAYDRVKFNLDLSEEVPLKNQQRAYTSPIWYAPEG